ncbi:hypothetical protein J3F83DRAFT_728746 [Trichoderma novae-zelandiae]
MAPNRRRTGVVNCRNRRVKCDEARPVCGRCRSRNLDCSAPDFIVHDRRSTRPPRITRRRQAEAEQSIVSSPTLPATPESTYDVFRQVQLVQSPVAGAIPPPAESQSPVITEEVLDLVRKYQSGIGAWMDVLDHSSTYRRQVTRRAASSALLMYSICALSAKQMSLVGEHSAWEPVAGRFYGQSLRLLIHDLSRLDTSYGEVLVATILLSSYELLAVPGPEYRRHLEGVSSLLRSHQLSSVSADLDRASFWIYARHDVAMALINYCPPLIATSEWPDAIASRDSAEDAMGNQVLWLLARVIELRFTPLSSSSSTDNHEQNLRQVGQEVDKWWDELPLTSHGLSSGEQSGDGLSQLWFCAQSAAAGLLYYHVAKILLLEASLHGSQETIPGREHYGNGSCIEQLHSQSRSIASICFSPGMDDGVLVVAVNPLYYAAKYAPSLSLKVRIWALLDKIETGLGFHTRSRVMELQRELESQIGT